MEPNGFGNLCCRNLAMAVAAMPLADIGLVYASSGEPASSELAGASPQLLRDQDIEVQVAAVAGSHMGVEDLHLHGCGFR